MSKKKVLNALLEEVHSVVKATKDFTIEQAPDVAKEIIAEETFMQKQSFFQSIAFLVVGLLLAYGSLSIPGPYTDHYSMSGTGFLMIVGISFSLLFIFIGICGAWNSYIELGRLKLAPKYFLLKKLSRLVKQ